eukprot:3749803-Alexandrium_andersonii.AAC.1
MKAPPDRHASASCTTHEVRARRWVCDAAQAAVAAPGAAATKGEAKTVAPGAAAAPVKQEGAVGAGDGAGDAEMGT